MGELSIAIEPRLRQTMLFEEDVVLSYDTYREVSDYIKDNADTEGYFDGEYCIVQDDLNVIFKIHCRLMKSPFPEDNGAIMGVRFYHAYVDVIDEDNKSLTHDFTKEDLEDFLKD